MSDSGFGRRLRGRPPGLRDSLESLWQRLLPPLSTAIAFLAAGAIAWAAAPDL